MDIEDFEKQCNRCYETKPLSNFYKASGKHTYMAHCKHCHAVLYPPTKKEKRHQDKMNQAHPIVSFRVSPVEEQKLSEAATQAAMSIPDFIRQAIRNAAHRAMLDTGDSS